jgi:predicted MFS family arabinose efflux permease
MIARRRVMGRGSRIALIFALASAFFLVIGNIIVIPVILPFMRADLALTESEAAALLVSFPLSAAVSNIVLGSMSDALGRTRFFLTGLGLGTIAFALAAAADTAIQQILLRAAAGLLMPMVGTTVFALIADAFTEDERLRVTGFVQAGSSLASLCIIPVSMLIGTNLSWRLVFVALSALSAVTAGVALLALAGSKEAVRAKLNLRAQAGAALSLLSDPCLNRLLAAQFLQSFGFFVILSFFPTWVVSRFPGGDVLSRPVLLFVFGGLGGLAGSIGVGWTTRFGEPLRVAAVLLLAAALAAAALGSSGRTFVLCTVVWTLFSAFRQQTMPLLIHTGNLLCRSDSRATLQAGMNTAFQLGSALGAAAGSALYPTGTSFASNGLAGAAMLVGASLLVRRLANARRRATSPPA